MPTVLRIDGLRVVIHSNDHRPAHVHAIRKDKEAIFLLNCPNGPIELRVDYGFNNREVGQIRNFLTTHLPDLCQQWSEIHGGY